MKADKMYFMYVHSCGFSPPLSYSGSWTAGVCICVHVYRMYRYVSLSRLPLSDNILRHDGRSISMRIYADVSEIGGKNQSMQKCTKTCAMSEEKRALQIHVCVPICERP